MNAYLSFAGVTQTYDTNGNLTNDGNLTFAYDFANRMVEIRDNEDNSLIASYSYDAFNRRISKSVQSTTVSQGDTSGSEYQSDRRTIALYHFNNSSGPIVDSSGNGNDAGPRKRIATVAGLYGTNAAGFSGKRLTAPASSSLDSITDKLTVEAWVYIQPGDGEVKCRLVHRQESFILKIRKDTAKAVFKVFIDQGATEPIIARAVSDSAIPMQTWVHLAGVYNGKKVKLFVNGVKQRKKTTITGNVHRLPDARLVLGSQNFHGRLEEVRISNKARSGFPGASTPSQQVLRHFFYAGWTCIEEREQAVLDGGSFGPEKLTRQFVDGANIDEHICVDYYADDGITVAKTYFYHANHRGDIVALTDAVGAVVLELRCTAYGRAAKVDQQGLLQEFDDFSLVVFGFQSRRLDEESFLYHFRSRQYNPVTGRFCQRDGLGYVDGYNLYLAFRGAPVYYLDPKGLWGETCESEWPDPLPGSPVAAIPPGRLNWIDELRLRFEDQDAYRRAHTTKWAEQKEKFSPYYFALRDAEHALWVASQISRREPSGEKYSSTAFWGGAILSYTLLKFTLESVALQDLLCKINTEPMKPTEYEAKEIKCLDSLSNIIDKIEMLDNVKALIVIDYYISSAQKKLGKNASRSEILLEASKLVKIRRDRHFLAGKASPANFSEIFFALIGCLECCK